jgi:Uma2 family endonuclease
MSTLLTSSPEIPRLSDLLSRLGDVPASRVRYFPLPGTATVDDVVEIHDREKRLCELVDGVLVEKPMGFKESLLAGAILAALRAFVVPRKLGVVSGEAGMMQLLAGLVRMPDVAYVSAARLPNGRVPREPVPLLVPDLAVEVLSKSNTRAEMKRKREEYFRAGVRLVWMFDPDARSAEVYTDAATPPVRLSENDTIDGGAVLPGFTLSLHDLFAELDAQLGG